MLKSEKKKYVFKQLDQLLKPQGYRATKTGGPPTICWIKIMRNISFILTLVIWEIYISQNIILN